MGPQAGTATGAVGEDPEGSEPPRGRSPEDQQTEMPGTGGKVRRVMIRGEVPAESWSELFRCFVNPAVRMNLKKLRLGVGFDMELPEGQELAISDPALKAMKEAARQLGLDLEIDGDDGGSPS